MMIIKTTSSLCLLVLTLSSFSAWAENSAQTGDCLHLFKSRRDGFAIATGVVPVAGAGVVAGAGYVGGLIGARSSGQSLGGAVAGLGAGVFFASTAVIATEIGMAVKLGQSEKMFQLVRQVEQGSGPALDRGYKQFIRRHSEFKNKVSEDQYIKQVFEWDQSHALCDGSLKTKKPGAYETRLKKILVTPRELETALAKEFSATP